MSNPQPVSHSHSIEAFPAIFKLLQSHTELLALVTLFVHWLYHQEIPTDGKVWARLSMPSVHFFWMNYGLREYIKAYSFGDRFAVPAFSRASNNALAQTDLSGY
ncbi:hypothetical protein HBI56_119090 [Parastagonospora nodorum]|nr:hypothetical protein HBH56_055670 [Parastagonospora nodorum]KAH3935938.1 hypothetical protein HBH54_041480 [Parastagonospora nodorum]KAH3970034.1 hypothetical protein HBH51_121610 [Parastagonospora nodorum]KAH3988894.1 hypothetical protein HBH52_030110 [Parastagonospora nodorum]KAH4037474.1 hypothetical protein HBI09_071070 [Parastagonospora nodorum]